MDSRRKQWKIIEANICETDLYAYHLRWGAEREKFYGHFGTLDLPIADKNRLRSLKNTYKGNRIFIIGNGPSLNNTDLHLLESEYTFGVNRIYLLYDRIKWKPTFYTALDWRVVPDIAHEINGLTGSTFFFEERFRGLLRESQDVYFYTHSAAPQREKYGFSFDISEGVRGAGSVVGSAIQIAYYLGFSPIYLIGCDLGYRVKESVVQDGEDKFGNGTKLLLTSTENDDDNHFDSRYFGKGRRWHDPNVKRMVEGHKHCRAAIEENGGKILNATVGGELEVYQRVDFKSLFADRNGRRADYFRTFERGGHAHIDETQIVCTLLECLRGTERTMIDIGAHCGSSARHFVDQGWRIYCFEPDPTNRGRLTTLFGDKGNVTIDPRAVSDRVERGKPLFSSPESTGISALHAFRDTHKQTELVDVTNITQIVEEYKLDRIDFLKIDVEGFDFAVLRGVPWDRIKPAVIECEFEDAKTVPLGHTWKEIAEFLVAKGYAVYVSEWHPIVRYGIQHDWCRLFRYPGLLRDPQAWGNLLAFLEDPGPEAMADALSACLKVTHPKPASTMETSPPLQPAGAVVKHAEAIRATSQAVQAKADEARVRNAHENGGCETPTVKETPNARVNVARDQDPVSEKMTVELTPNADWCRRLVAKLTGEHTMLRPFVKFLEWSAGAIARHWPGVLGAVVAAVSLLGVAFWFAPGLWLYWLAAFSLFTAGGIAFLAIGYGQHFFSCYAAKQADELEHRSAEIWRLQQDIGRLRSEIVRAVAAHADEFKRDLASVQAVSHATDRALADVRTQIADTLDAVRSRQDALDRAVAAHADEFKRDLASVQAVSHATDRALADVRTQVAADKTLAAEAVDAVRNQDTAFRKLNSSNASLARPFNRFLSPEYIQRLTQYWSKVFGVTMSPSAISYLAHRMCVAEDQCEGRLACSIETAMLRQYALRSLKGDRLDVLEIGALFGLGSAFLYKFTGPEQSEIHLTLIDPLEGYYGSNRLDPSTGIPVDRRTLERNYTTLGIPREAWRLIQRLSTDAVAAQEAADRQYDLVLIDGDHSAAGVARDYEMYAPMIKPGGLIIFDDYGSGHWPSIQPFVDEYVQPDGRWMWIGAEWNTAILRRRHEEGYVHTDQR